MTALDQATILLTGATGGFGQEMIKQFLQKNGRLILTDIDQNRLADVAQSHVKTASRGEIVACFATDLATDAGRQKLYHFYESLALPLDVLVNNAGVAVYGRFDEIPADSWQKLVEINLLAAMHLSYLFMPIMIARGKGHIVNISSMAGWAGTPGLAAYSASKYGLRGFSEAIFDELAPHGVCVTAVYPFFSRTPILNSPQFGTMPRGSLAESMLSDPVDVIRAVVQGIEQHKQHIFPDKTAKQIHLLKRFWPSLLPRLAKRMQLG